MGRNGLEVKDCNARRVLLPFDKVVKMERDGSDLWIKTLDPTGVSVKISDQKEVDRVWCDYQAWLTGPSNP